MYDLGMARISGSNRLRSSIFAAAATDMFHSSGGALGGRVSLGQTGQELYARAKAAVAKFDQQVEMTKRIANKAVRESLAVQYGLTDPGNKDRARYMRDAVALNISQAEASSPINYLVWEIRGPAAGRVPKLEAFDREFAAAVKQAGDYYGILPEPEVIERIVEVEVPGAPGKTNWVLPVVVIGGAIGIAALLGAFK